MNTFQSKSFSLLAAGLLAIPSAQAVETSAVGALSAQSNASILDSKITATQAILENFQACFIQQKLYAPSISGANGQGCIGTLENDFEAFVNGTNSGTHDWTNSGWPWTYSNLSQDMAWWSWFWASGWPYITNNITGIEQDLGAIATCAGNGQVWTGGSSCRNAAAASPTLKSGSACTQESIGATGFNRAWSCPANEVVSSIELLTNGNGYADGMIFYCCPFN